MPSPRPTKEELGTSAMIEKGTYDLDLSQPASFIVL
jgi:hypothetical protein